MNMGTYKVIKQPRTKGRYTSWALRLKKTLRVSGLVCALGWIIFGSVKYGAFEQARTLIAYADSATSTVQVTTGHSIKENQDKALSFLDSCEWGGGPLVINDNNSRGSIKGKDIQSYGHFRFKIGTIQAYEKLLNGKDVSEHDAIIIGISQEDSRELARQIIFESKAGIEGDWINCSEYTYTFNGYKMKLKDIVIAIKSVSV